MLPLVNIHGTYSIVLVVLKTPEEFHQKKFMAFCPFEPDDLLSADADPARAVAVAVAEVPSEVPAAAAPADAADAPGVEVETRSEVCNCCSLQ